MTKRPLNEQELENLIKKLENLVKEKAILIFDKEPSDNEVAYLTRELRKIIHKNIYYDFIESIKGGDLGKYMIKGKQGEIRQNYYRNHYVHTLINEFTLYFLKHWDMFRVCEAGCEQVLKVEKFHENIYPMFMSGMAFVGSYLTHTPNVSFHDKRLFVIETIHSTSPDNRKMMGQRRLICFECQCIKSRGDRHRIDRNTYSEKVYQTIEFGDGFEIFNRKDNINVIGVVSSKDETMAYDSNNNIYLIKSNVVNKIMTHYTQLDKGPYLENIKIGGLFQAGPFENINEPSSAFFIISLDEGQVFVKGRCGKLIGENAAVAKVVNIFTPVVVGNEMLKGIVDIHHSNKCVWFVDNNNEIYEFVYDKDKDGGVYKRPNAIENRTKTLDIYPLSILTPVSVRNRLNDEMNDTKDDNTIILSKFNGRVILSDGSDDKDGLVKKLKFGNDHSPILSVYNCPNYEIMFGEITNIVVFSTEQALHIFAFYPSSNKLITTNKNSSIIKHGKGIETSKNEKFRFQCVLCKDGSGELNTIFHDPTQDVYFCKKECQPLYYKMKFESLLNLSSFNK